MEGGKQSGSSLASDLFGAKDSSPAASSSGIFGSMFPPPPKVVGHESFLYSETEKKINSENPTWTAKNGVSEMLQVAKGESRARQGRTTVHIIRRRRCSPFTTAHQYTTAVKMFILDPRVLRIRGLLSVKMREKTTRAVLQEGTGGRDLFTIKT